MDSNAILATMKFPVLVLDAKVMVVVNSRHELTRANDLALRQQYLKNALLADISGHVWRVRDVRKLEPIGGIFKREYQLALQLEPLTSDDVDQLVRLRAVDKLNGVGWNSMIGVERLASRLNAALSVAEIVGMLSRATR